MSKKSLPPRNNPNSCQSANIVKTNEQNLETEKLKTTRMILKNIQNKH